MPIHPTIIEHWRSVKTHLVEHHGHRRRFHDTSTITSIMAATNAVRQAMCTNATTPTWSRHGSVVEVSSKHLGASDVPTTVPRWPTTAPRWFHDDSWEQAFLLVLHLFPICSSCLVENALIFILLLVGITVVGCTRNSKEPKTGPGDASKGASPTLGKNTTTFCPFFLCVARNIWEKWY